MLSSWIDTDGHGRPVELADGTELQWSADGELLKTTSSGGAETQFGYDGFGRLVEVTLPDGRIGRYRYDALGRRSAARLDGTMIRRYVYGGSEFPRARIDAGGDVLERYVYASQTHAPDLIVRRDGQRLRLVTDALGSVRAVVDVDTGQVVQRLAYDAYGRTTQDTAPGTQPFGYKGAASDPIAEGAGLIWMGVRAYLPTIGRFTTVDSAGLAGGWNQHDALRGDPVDFIDPDGRQGVRVGPTFFPFPGGSPVDPALSNAVERGLDWLGQQAQKVSQLASDTLSRWTDLCFDGLRDAFGIDAAAGDDDGDGGGADPTSAEELLDELPDGRSPGVKEVPNEEALNELFDDLTRGGERVDSSYPGTQVRLPDGTLVGLRPNSKSGGATIDVKLPGGGTIKVHLP